MADVMDPQSIEEQTEAEQESYKVYKRRWLVLFAMFSVILVVGLHRSIISIADILEQYMDMTEDNYNIMAQTSMYTTLLSVLAMARALDYFGLRRVAYLACAMIICANGLKAICCADEKYVTAWIKDQRYYILLLSEAFVGLAQSIAVCVPSKVASVWFAHYENTIALVIANCGFNIGIGSSNFFTPRFVSSTDDMYKLSYMFIISGILVTLIVLTCVTRSSPKIPPSHNAITASTMPVPLKSGIIVMLTNPQFLLLLITLTLNISILNVEQLKLNYILKSQQYSNTFCGTLIAHAYFFGTFFMLMGGAWIDNSSNYIKVSRISSVLCALAISTFNMSILVPNIKNVILVTNLMAAFGCSLMYPALFQVSLRGAASILPEATVSAIIMVFQQAVSALMMNLFGPLKKLSPTPDGYQAPLIIFCCFAMIMNLLYVTSFTQPSKEELLSRLRPDTVPIVDDDIED